MFARPFYFLAHICSPQGKKTVNYAESDDDEEDVFSSIKTSQARRRGRQRSNVVDDDEEDYEDGKNAPLEDEDGMILAVVEAPYSCRDSTLTIPSRR